MTQISNSAVSRCHLKTPPVSSRFSWIFVAGPTWTKKLLFKASGWGIVLFWVSQLHFMPADHKRAQLINFKKSCLNIPLVHLLKSGTVLWREGIFQKPDSERLTKVSVSKGHLFWLYVALEPFNEGSFSDTRGSKNKNPVLWFSLSKDLLISQGLIWCCAIVDDSVFSRW